MIYEQTTGNSSGSPKGNTIPSSPSGSSKGPIIPSSASGSTSGKFGEPPAKVPRVENFNSDPFVTDDGFPLSNAAVEGEDDVIVSVRDLPRLVGKPSSSIQAVFSDPLHYRFLLRAKNVALKKTQSCESYPISKFGCSTRVALVEGPSCSLEWQVPSKED